MAELPIPAARLGVRRHPAFLRLWSADGISALGSQVTMFALPVTAVAVLHAPAFAVALLATASTLPNLVVGLPAGLLVDRRRRRPVMIAADLGRAAALTSVPAAWWLGVLGLGQLYAVALVCGALSVCFEIAAAAYLPDLLDRSQLVDANARLEGNRVVASAAGPGAAGGLVSLLTAPVAVVADAASFVASAALVRSIDHAEARRGERPRGASRRELREGAAYVLRHPYLRPLLLSTALANLVIGIVWSVVIVYALRTLGIAAGLVGVLLSLGQVGGFLGVTAARPLAERIGVGRVAVLAYLLFGPAALVLAAAPVRYGPLFLAAGWAIENLARALYAASAASVRQALVPAELQGRVNGVGVTVGMGAFPLGTAIGGGLAAGLGLRGTMLVGAALAFAAFVPVALSPVRRIRGLSELG